MSNSTLTPLVELLAPGGDIDSIKAAIAAGADAIYCGLERFNARNRAGNISLEELPGILRLAHRNHCEVFLTLNIIIIESEIPSLMTLLNRLVNTKIDGLIIQDLGMLYILSTYFPRLKVHASTQLTTHNQGQLEFLRQLKVCRVNLSRELSLEEIRDLSAKAHYNKMLTEVFVHGSNCISFSGICYFSSVNGGNSGNRGRCSQPCRGQYLATPVGKCFPLNLKDNSAYADLGELIKAGVDSIKIEGRIKKFHYVYTVVSAYGKQLQRLLDNTPLQASSAALYTVFNRDFSNAFLRGEINKEMYIDNPRDHSAIHLAKVQGSGSPGDLERAKGELYDRKTAIISTVRAKISRMDIAKAPLQLRISGELGRPLKISIQTPDEVFVVSSEGCLTRWASVDKGPFFGHKMFEEIFKALNDTEYFIEDIELHGLQPDLFIAFKQLTILKKMVLFILNDSREIFPPVILPQPVKSPLVRERPVLSVLISSPEDLALMEGSGAEISFELPNCFTGEGEALMELFQENQGLIPWFPAILLGDAYRVALRFLERVQPRRIITDNLGIAHAAYLKEISWVAGPQLNCVNSWSLRCLREKFDCSGAFVSNEINRNQIKAIRRPDAEFDIYYSIYHPLVLMTSRQCLFHQVTGCGKTMIDEECLLQCRRSAEITNLKGTSFLLEKVAGRYHSIYGKVPFLNTEILGDIPNFFTGLSIDLRDINTVDLGGLGKAELVRLFQEHLAGRPAASAELHNFITSSSNRQYTQGI